MSDDSETVVDTKKGLLAEMTDDSCEAVTLDRPSDDYHTSEVIYPVVEVKPEDPQEIKQEPADENDNGDSHFYVKLEPDDEYKTGSPCFAEQVSSMLVFSTIFCKATHTVLKREILHNVHVFTLNRNEFRSSCVILF